MENRALLKTERLHIRRIECGDWENIRNIWLDFEKSAYARYDVPHNTDSGDVRERVARWAKTREGNEHIFLSVCLGDTVIGYLDAHNTGCGYEIGYCFHSCYHGKGYAKESITALIGYMREIGETRLTAGTALANRPSVRLLTSLGFKQVATEKVSFYKDENGNDIIFDGGMFELKI